MWGVLDPLSQGRQQFLLQPHLATSASDGIFEVVAPHLPTIWCSWLIQAKPQPIAGPQCAPSAFPAPSP